MIWEERKIGELIKLQRGHDLPSSKRNLGSIPIISSSGITDFHDDFKANGEGVVTGRYGTLGEVFYVKGKYWPLNTSLYVKDFKGNHPKFIYYFLKSIHLERYNGAAAVPGIDRNVIHKLRVKFPIEICSQKKIASILSAYDDLIENNNQRIKLLEEMAEEIYKEWFVRVRFPGYQDIKFFDKDGNEVAHFTVGALPEGWEEIQLEKIIDFRVDNRGRNPEYYCDEGIPVLDNHLITNSPFVNLAKAKRFLDDNLFSNFLRKYLKKNDVLITLVGTLGSIAMAPEEKCAIVQNTIGLRCNNLCNQYFLLLSSD